MVIQKPSISPQYLREEEICVSILEVKSPSHFIIKESPSQENSVAKEFFYVEHSMQNYYQSVAEDFLQVPRKDSVVVVKHKEKYYRAQVRSLFNVSHGDIFKVYLLDYGRECNVSREDLYLIHEQFLEYPFQAVELKLLDIEPISLIVDELYCSLDYGRVSTWDPSAIAFIEDLCKVMNNAYVKVKGVGENFLFGEFYIILENQKTLCLNEVLKEKKFAQAKEDFWDDVIPIGDFLPKPNANAVKDVPNIICNKSPPKLQSSECTSTPTSEAHSTEKSPSSSITRTPHSENQLLSRSQKLKMLGKKAPSESPTSSTSLIVPNSNPTQVPNSLGDVNMNGSSNVNNESGKLIPPVAVLGSKTPPKIKVCGKAQLNKLKKLQALKKASPSPQKAPDSSTPLNNHSLPCHSLPSLSTQQSCRQIDGISPIQGASLDLTSLQKSETDLSSMKNDTNSLNVGFMNSTQPKDAKKNAEPSENEKSSSIDAISPNLSSSSKSFQKLKSLCRKKLPTSPQPESKKEPDEKTPTHPLGPSRETVSESETQMPKETDPESESLSPKFVEEYPDGITDPIDSDDELESVLKPRRISVNDSGLSSDDCSRRSSISNDIMSDLQCVNDIDFSNKSLWEKQKVPALCIGEAIPTPVLSTGEASFPSALQKTLESVKFCGPSCIQSVVWPAVERRRCLAAIAPPHSGKTVAYLLPLVANFMSPLIHVNLPKANGPIVIIICSSWKKVQAVHDFFQLFLSGFKCKITCLFPGGHKRSKVIGMLNGCEILISVPSCLISFFKDEVICLKRCCHFILDDGSTLLSRNMPEIKELMYHFTKGIELRSSIPISLQIMICAERWSKAVSSFVDKFMHSPLLLFTSFLEAAVYANIPMHAHVCRDEDKKQKLLGMLEISKKIIICTDKSSTAFEIHDFLKCENVRSFLVNEEMEHYISDGVIQDWKSVRSAATPHCLILTDMCLNHLSISNANVLIHYDVPEVSRLQFGNRFSCIAEHFKNMENSPDCACHILVSENCSLQAPSLIKLVHRSGVAVPLELKDLSAKRTVKKNNDAPLCHYMKSFGTCTLTNCPQRHHIDPECDKPSITPCEGDIAGLVTHVCDPTHLYVRLLQYLSPGLTSLSGTYAQVGFQLESFYKIEANRTRVKEPVVGRTYVLQDETGLFFRVKVLEIIPATLAQRQKMKLLFRDEGWVQSLDSCQLFEYISRDHFPPPLVVEVHLCGLRTPDTSLDWNPQARRYLTHLVEGKEIHGKIVLCLGETLWLHPAVLRERALHTHEYLNVLSLDKSLKDAEYAAYNQKHLPMLIAACENKIPLPKEIKRISEVDETVEDEEQMIQYSYAFLELNVYENVFVSSVISPQEFYVQREKFVKCLDNLLESIEEKLKANKLEKCKTFLNGMHCLAPFQEDNSYYRAEVTEVIPDCGEVQVFFVDFGDFGRVSKDTLFAIPPKFLLLPFQAIKCELRGICAPHGGWTKKAGDTLYNLTRNEEGDMNILQIKAYEKTQQYSNGNHYIVDLWYEDKSISDQLLSAGLVCPAENSTSEKTAEEENGSAVDNLDATENARDIFDEIMDGYVASSDEDMCDEDKLIHAQFVATIARKMYSPREPTEEKVVEDEKAKKVSKKKLKKVVEVVDISPTVKRSPFQETQRLLNCMKSEPKRAKPFIKWWDTLEHVNIFIILRNIEIYELDMQDNKFIFSTTLRGMDYHTVEEFYSSVHSSDAIVKITSDGLKIIFKKQTSGKWPHLTKTKFSHIKYDLDHIDVSDSEEMFSNEVSLAEMEKPDENLIAHYDSEESNSSEDDDYVQTWRKMAQFRDPHDPWD